MKIYIRKITTEHGDKTAYSVEAESLNWHKDEDVRFTDLPDDLQEIINWCKETIGAPSKRIPLEENDQETYWSVEAYITGDATKIYELDGSSELIFKHLNPPNQYLDVEIEMDEQSTVLFKLTFADRFTMHQVDEFGKVIYN